jgi:hypothetical protein
VTANATGTISHCQIGSPEHLPAVHNAVNWGSAGLSANLLAAIDKASRLRLRIFALKVVTIIPVSIALAVHRGYPIIGIVVVCCAWNSLFSGLAALFQRHRYDAPSLTAWDEMAAFLGITTLLHLLQPLMS